MSRGSNNFEEDTKRIGSVMVISAWLVFLGLLTLYFGQFLDSQENPNQQVISQRDAEKTEITLRRNRQGHYVASGEINNRAVVFMLDTGATSVSVPGALSKQLDLRPGTPVTVQTANGAITVAMTELAQVRLGDIVIEDVQATINPYMDGDIVLLGMSFLKQLEFTQRGDELILRQY